MDRRLVLHDKLKDISGHDRVYFQPPQNVELEYPCIVYEKDSFVARHADNVPFVLRPRFSVIHISRDPDDETPQKLAALPLSRHTRYYRADKLHHHVFTLY